VEDARTHDDRWVWATGRDFESWMNSIASNGLRGCVLVKGLSHGRWAGVLGRLVVEGASTHDHK
jgi:hypothetical protein